MKRSFSGSTFFSAGPHLLGLAFLFAAAPAVLGGCVGNVLIGQEGAADSDSSSSKGNVSTTSSSGTGGLGGETTSSGTTGGGATSYNAIALLGSQVPSYKAKEWRSSGPEMLFVIFTEEAVTCGAPLLAPDYSLTSLHQVIVGLPPSMQAVGKYDLSSSGVSAFRWDWLTDGGGNGGGGGGPLTTGAIEIVSIDATSVHARITGVGATWLDAKSDQVAPRCP